jgi:hypothetical protein
MDARYSHSGMTNRTGIRLLSGVFIKYTNPSTISGMLKIIFLRHLLKSLASEVTSLETNRINYQSEQRLTKL